ncbi:MAG: hypothetical protein BGO21_22560 [Dyadobacter sp. 50-39]|uniref:DUF6934 family protein n=1 Tax=Dyadobacter sp. 50-39 TaxID=1895756 RepID=UPI00095E9C55|nr:hypothetical protein [Dyadobacter sp. 50-39]OJV18343.1 MAG: hypothetical protein BGO21_22560 [Dyadobacter sp. 50-39]
MELHTYPLAKTSDLKSYSFWSAGPNGFVRKVIKFQLISHEKQLYNLAFGDCALDSEFVDDRAVSNNGDTQIILATVATAASQFMADHPGATVLATGSTVSRTRLYQMGISKFFVEISSKFAVKGYLNGDWLHFERNNNYEAFLLEHKELNLK